jgi:hypothetical protein
VVGDLNDKGHKLLKYIKLLHNELNKTVMRVRGDTRTSPDGVHTTRLNLGAIEVQDKRYSVHYCVKMPIAGVSVTNSTMSYKKKDVAKQCLMQEYLEQFVKEAYPLKSAE